MLPAAGIVPEDDELVKSPNFNWNDVSVVGTTKCMTHFQPLVNEPSATAEVFTASTPVTASGVVVAAGVVVAVVEPAVNV